MGADENSGARPAKLLDRVRAKLRLLHYAKRTEEAYVDWIKRYIFFHNKRHPKEMGAAEIEAYLTHLAVEGFTRDFCRRGVKPQAARGPGNRAAEHPGAARAAAGALARGAVGG